MKAYGREYWKKILPTLIAFTDGKEIQVNNGDGDWRDQDTFGFFNEFEYRIKPTPLECWVNVYRDGGMDVHRFEGVAKEQSVDVPTISRVAVHMREVESSG